VKKPLCILIAAMCVVLIGCPDIDPATELSSISVTHLPTKTDYFVGDSFEPGGLEVTALYSDNTSAVIYDYDLSEPDMNSAGPKTITVTYQGMTADFGITVSVVTLSTISVAKSPDKTVYYIGDTFDSDGLEVNANYSNGSSSAITGYDLSDPDMSGTGIKTITVTFEDKITSFTIRVRSDEEGDLEIIIY